MRPPTLRHLRHALSLLTLAAAVFLLGVGATGQSPAADRKAPAERHPAKEDTYTITSVLKVLPPVDPAVMNDDFQEVRMLAGNKDSVTLEVTYYPLHQQVVGEDANWRKDDAAMRTYLQPTPAENWDAAMRRDLIAQLRAAGIDPGTLTDKKLVEQVSRWAMRRARTTDAFAIWDIYYPKGKPAVYPALRAAFNDQKPSPAWTDQQMFDQEALGKAMFYAKVHGSCTSSSIYLTTILRALGIPTRTVFCIPPFDPNDEAQARKFYAAVHQNVVRETVRAALDGMTGFDNHLFNEVYVGHRWVRLNYDRLGQPILDAHYFGLLTHIATSADLSRTPLAQTWGMRYAGNAGGQAKLSSVNPYMLLSVRDHFGKNAPRGNPPVPVAELRTATITGLYPKGTSALPQWVRDNTAADTSFDFFIAIREWIAGSNYQMRAYQRRASHTFLLIAPGQPDLRVTLSGPRDSTGDGSFQAFGARILNADRAKLVPGIAYTLAPQNSSETYRWTVAPGVMLTMPVK